ncbi:MAG: acyltransferase [Alistipes sp.]|nr:acyltransferase [Alistipes sp.]
MSNTNQNTERIVWLDLLRFVAILMVIACHSVDIYNATPQEDPSAGFWGGFIGSMMRPCVPLFAMMTGMLLLPVREPAKDFYRKRIPRILFPMLLWSIIYNLVPWITGVMGADKSVVSIFFPFEYSPSQELGDALDNIAMIPFAFNGYTTHMWYIYMLIGLYFFMPYLSGWVEKNDKTLTRGFVVLWGCSLMLPYLEQLFSKDILGVCAWNGFGLFHYFAGFVGYLLLGHLMGGGNRLRSAKAIAVGTMLYTSGFIITYSGYSTMAEQYTYEQAPQLLEMFWQYCSPNVVLMTIGIFLIVQRANVKSERAQSLLANVAKCGFGIYMIHYIFIGPAVMLLSPLGLPTPLCVILTVAIVFATSWGLTNIIYKLLPRAARYIVG